MNRNMTKKDTHLEAEVELYPREKTQSSQSHFPEKFERPLAVTV